MALQLLRWLLVDFCNQCGDDLVQVTDDSVVSGLEDPCLWIAVDGSDDLRATHALHVLGGAGDADRQVQGWLDVVSRPADVAALLEPAEIVGDGHRAGEFGVESLGETPYHGHVVLGPYAPAEGDDSLGVIQPGRHGDRLRGDQAHRCGHHVETAYRCRCTCWERHLVTCVDCGDGAVRGQGFDGGPAHCGAPNQHLSPVQCQTHDTWHQPVLVKSSGLSQ